MSHSGRPGSFPPWALGRFRKGGVSSGLACNVPGPERSTPSFPLYQVVSRSSESESPSPAAADSVRASFDEEFLNGTSLTWLFFSVCRQGEATE
jgi:hypothetical protein